MSASPQDHGFHGDVYPETTARLQANLKLASGFISFALADAAEPRPRNGRTRTPIPAGYPKCELENPARWSMSQASSKHAEPARIGHVAICEYRTCPIRPPLQTHLHAVCRGKIPARPKKVPSRKGNSAPDVGLRSPTPRRHSVISPALRFWDTRHDSPRASRSIEHASQVAGPASL